MDMEKLLQNLAATAELMGTQLSPMALAMMAKDLQEFPFEIIVQALGNVRKNSGRFNLAVIVAEIENLKHDDRLGVEEAWALYPHDEAGSAVITNEMAEAMRAAQQLVDEGDMIGGRMAFKEAYNRIVKTNKANGIEPKWFPTLGTCKEDRAQVLKDAVEKGRLTQDYATSLLPASINTKLDNTLGEMQLLTKRDDLTEEMRAKNKARMAEIKAMFTK